MLQAIRDGSKGPVAKIIVGLIILTFALFGIESIVALGGGEDAPATVNGEEISEYQVQQAVLMQKRRLQTQFGENFDPAIFKDELIRQSSVENLIQETVVKQAALKSGIQFSDADIDVLIVKSPDFHVNGKFDRDQFDLVLRSAGFTRATYRQLLRTSLLTQQLQNAWQTTSFATPLEVKQIANLEAQTRNFSSSTLSLAEMKKGITVSDEEIQQYYDENTESFMIPEKVSIKYVELKASELAKSVDISEDDVLEHYEALKADSNSKKEYRAAHILLLDSDEAAKDKMATIQMELKNGKAFEDLAKEYSQDDTSKFSGGDLGFADESVFETEFSQALTGLSVDGVSGVVETRDGLHLIKLLEVRQPEVAPLTELKDSIELELREEAKRVVYLEALETLKDEAFSSTNLEAVASSLDLEIQMAGPFPQAGGEGVAANRNVAMSAFSESVLSEGANSEVIEIEDGRAVVLHLNEFFEAKPKELTAVNAQIKTILINDKAVAALNVKADETLESAKAGTLQVKWDSFAEKTREFTGANREVVSTAFTLGISDDSPSYSLVDLQNGDKAIVRLEQINRDVDAQVGESQEQKMARIKSNNEFKALFEYNLEESDIEKG
ncbi:SurA N-terminal domain-containing protein [Oceaniserpentilla sp. 4NH20-0058]|uniref:SurA N-terminal domain-containing protein n=1 Tax=Oceaniserpentilla sp. 4NH20-0058 TaxID=3127660 RepID=UPI003108BDA9